MNSNFVLQHADFEQTCETNAVDRAAEEKMCDHLITAARRRDGVLAGKLVDKVVDVLTTSQSVSSDDISTLHAVKQVINIKEKCPGRFECLNFGAKVISEPESL